jgi:hypothetical protein
MWAKGVRARDFGSALAAIREERSEWCALFPALYSDNSDFNTWLNRSLQDLALLRTQTERRFSQVESAPISRDLEPIKPTARQVLSKVVSFRFTFP